MTKGRRATPARGLRSPVPSSKTAPNRPLDSQRIAAEIVAALSDAVIVTGLDRRAGTPNPAPADPFGPPLQDPPRTPIDDLLGPPQRPPLAGAERPGLPGTAQHHQ